MEKLNLPKTFADAGGRSWTVNIVWSTCKRIKDLAGVTIDELIRKTPAKGENPLSPFVELVTDFEALTNVLYAILKPDCDKLQPPLTLDDFRDGLAGNAIVDAKNAFCQALHDFFPDPQKSLLGTAVAAGLRAEAKAIAKFGTESTRLMAEMEARLDESLATMTMPSLPTTSPSSPPSSAAPASAASTPTP